MQPTKLSLLMQHLHLTAVELAAAIHVHPSLISRWKNGVRYFGPESEHFLCIADYIVDRDAVADYKNLEVYLKQYDQALRLSSRSDAVAALCRYLSMQTNLPYARPGDQILLPRTGEVHICQGGREKRNALLAFFDVAVTLPPGRNVYIMFGADVDRFLDNPTYYEKWTQKLRTLVEYGHHIHFIYNYSFASIINNLRNVFWLFAHESFSGYYSTEAGVGNSGNLFIVEDFIALTDFITDPKEKKIPLFSFSDRVIVNQLEKSFLFTRDRCQYLKSNTILKRPQEMFLYMNKRINADEALYIYDEYPFCFPVCTDLMSDVLADNGFTREEMQICLEKYMRLLQNPLRFGQTDFPIRYILNCDALQSLAGMEACPFPPHLFSDRPVLIRRQYFGRFLQEILRYIDQPAGQKHIEIAAIEGHYVSDNAGLMALVKKNLFAFVFPYFSTSADRDSMLFSNHVLISDACQYYRKLWCSLPDECRSISTIRAQLTSMVKQLDPENGAATSLRPRRSASAGQRRLRRG